MTSRSLNVHLHSLRTTLILFSVVPMLLVIVGLGWYGLRTLEKQVELRLQEDIELIARALRNPLSEALDRERPDRLARTLESTFEFGRVYSAYVYDTGGELIASSGPRRVTLSGDRAARVVSDEREQGRFEEIGGRSVYSYFLPLADSGHQVIGMLQLTRRGSEFRHTIGQMRTHAWSLLAIVSLTLIAAIVIGHHLAVGRHVRRIGENMRRVGSGDHDHRIAVVGAHEFRELARGINAMLDGMARSAREVSEARVREEALADQLRQSERMAAIGRLAAGVAHELGTPLAVADGVAQRALRPAADQRNAPAALRRIREEIDRMRQTVQRLLDYGRAPRLRRKPDALQRIAAAAVSQAADEAARREVRIDFTGPEDTPALSVDRLRLEQALGNLVSNAVYASRAGRVSLSWFADADSVGFYVDDDGDGVPAQDRARLFDPFFTTKPAGHGTGLGLSVALSAVAEHGGHIHIEDSPLGGARFRISLPREGNVA